jgi:hypothetical protein
VVITRDGSQALRQQIVVRETGAYFNNIALLAQILDGLDQQQFDSAALPARQSFKGLSTTS